MKGGFVITSQEKEAKDKNFNKKRLRVFTGKNVQEKPSIEEKEKKKENGSA
jgi:hypothetical protein